jgi:WD repeat-containing protein 61
VGPEFRYISGRTTCSIGVCTWATKSYILVDNTICNSSADKTIKVWDLAARAAVCTISESQEVWAVSWQPSSAAASAGAFVAGGEDGVVRWSKAAGAS